MMLWEPQIQTRFLDPLLALRSLRAELERNFDGAALPKADLPSLALYKKGDGLLLRAALPGLAAEDLALEVDGDTLTISGEWPSEPELEGALAQYGERPRGRFGRTLRLPFEVDASRVQAKLERGVLEIELSPSPASQPVKIPVLSQEAQRSKS